MVEDGFADPPVRTGVTVPADEARLLAPCEPQVLVGIAHNKTNAFNQGNRDHPLPIQAWHKSIRTVVGPGDAIHARRDVGTVNIEGELAVVIGRDTEGLTLDNAFDYVFGYTVVNDVTNVDRNAVDEKTFQGKGGHGYTPLGPWIETELDDPENVATTVIINGDVAAESGSFNLPSTVAESIVYVAPVDPSRSRRRDHERRAEHVRRRQPGRHGGDHPRRHRLPDQPCRLTPVSASLNTFSRRGPIHEGSRGSRGWRSPVR